MFWLDWDSLCRPGWTCTHEHPPAFVSCVLGLKTCGTTTGSDNFYILLFVLHYMWHACFIDQHCQDFKSLNLEKNLRHGIIYLLKELEFVLGCHPLYCFKFVQFHKILYQITFQQNLFSKNKIVRRRYDLNYLQPIILIASYL